MRNLFRKIIYFYTRFFSKKFYVQLFIIIVQLFIRNYKCAIIYFELFICNCLFRIIIM